MITLTVEKALAIQATQLAHYSAMFPHRAEELRAKLAAETTSTMLTPGVEYDVIAINRHVPRGGWFETNIPEIVASEAAAKIRLSA